MPFLGTCLLGSSCQSSNLLCSQCPVGGWPQDKRRKEIGQWAQMALFQDVEGYVLFIASVVQGWTKEEVAVFIAHLRREIRSGKHHAYFKIKAVWGRKPESAE